MSMPSLWTDDDQKALAELVRKRGFADVALGLKHIAWKRHLIKSAPNHADWPSVCSALIRVYDHLKEKRPLKD